MAEQYWYAVAFVTMMLAVAVLGMWALVSMQRNRPRGNTLTRPVEDGLPRNWDDGTLTDQIRRINTAWTRILVHIGVGRLRKNIQRRITPTTTRPHIDSEKPPTM